MKKQFLEFVESKKNETSKEKDSVEKTKDTLDQETKKLTFQEDLIKKINEISDDTSLNT
jgi:hypothetical protein